MIRAIRVRRRVIQTPVVTYRNGQQTVTVTATCHVGTADYYKELLAIIAGLEAQGATVLYEETVSAPDDQWAMATDEERRARDFMNPDRDNHVRELVVAGLGWSTQHDLGYPSSWRNADLTDLEIIRRAGPETVVAALSRDTAAGEADHVLAARFQAVMVVMLRVQAAWPALARRIVAMVQTEASRRLDPVITGNREDEATRMIPQDADAVLIWGYDHLPGLDAKLVSAGFSRCGESWLGVGRMPSLRRRVAGREADC